MINDFVDCFIDLEDCCLGDLKDCFSGDFSGSLDLLESEKANNSSGTFNTFLLITFFLITFLCGYK